MRLRNRNIDNGEISVNVNKTAKNVTTNHRNIARTKIGLRDVSNAAVACGQFSKRHGEQRAKNQRPNGRRVVKRFAIGEQSSQNPNTSPGNVELITRKFASTRAESGERGADIEEKILISCIKETDENSGDHVSEYDYDAEHMDDPNGAPVYANDIFKYHRSRESKFHVGYYLNRQRSITKKMRAILVNWISEMQEEIAFSHETLYLAVKLMDVYFDRCLPNTVIVCQMQTIAAATLFIASKFEERWPPLIDDLISASGGAFNHAQLVQMEQNVLKAVGFDIGAPLSYTFLRRYAKVAKFDMKLLTLARYILETSLLFYEFIPVSESMMAAASLLLAIRMSKLDDWNGILIKYSGYKLDEIEPLMWSLNHMMHSFAKYYSSLKNIYDKYSDPTFFRSTEVGLLPDLIPQTQPVGPPLQLSFNLR